MSAGSAAMTAKSGGALVLGDAGGGLVEEEDARARGEREGDLEQALLAVGEGAGRAGGGVGELEPAEDGEGLVDGGGVGGEAAPELAGGALALADGERDGLDRA